MSNRKTTGVSLSEEALKMLKKHAKKENRTHSNFLENLVANELMELGFLNPSPSKTAK
jgi:ferritin-like protein